MRQIVDKWLESTDIIGESSENVIYIYITLYGYCLKKEYPKLHWFIMILSIEVPIWVNILPARVELIFHDPLTIRIYSMGISYEQGMFGKPNVNRRV